MMNEAFLIILVILCGFVLIFLITWSTISQNSPPMPSSKASRMLAIQMIQNQFSPKQILEAGSGWGGFAFDLANSFPEAKVTGVESSWIPYFWSLIRLKCSKVKNLNFIHRKLNQLDYQHYDTLTCYLGPDPQEKILPLWNQQCPNSTLFISIAFSFKPYRENLVAEASDLSKTPVYLYQKPFRPHRHDEPSKA